MPASACFIFAPGTGPAPLLFARVEAQEICVDSDGQPLSLTSLVGRTVSAATTNAGALFLAFADGATLRCGPDEKYESWQVEGGKPLSVIVCRPHGELWVWDETPPIPYDVRERDPATAAVLDEELEAMAWSSSGFAAGRGEEATASLAAMKATHARELVRG